MTTVRRAGAAAAVAGLMLCAASPGRAASAGRHGGGEGRASLGQPPFPAARAWNAPRPHAPSLAPRLTLDPAAGATNADVRHLLLAQAEPAPAAGAGAAVLPRPEPGPAASRTPGPSADAAAGGAAPAAAPAPVACTGDAACPTGTICVDGTCQPFERRTNVLYLYYHEGSFTEFLGLYWHRSESPGYRVLAPLWWHFWSPTSETKLLAPFYLRIDDFARQRTLRFYTPFWMTVHAPGADAYALWPLFYASSRHGWAALPLGSFKLVDPEAHSAFGAWGYLAWWSRTPERSWDLVVPFAYSQRSKHKAFTFALPLNFYWRNEDDANLLALPFFYWNGRYDGSLLATWLGYRSRSGANTRGSLFWLYWYGRTRTEGRAYDVLFPLVWSFRSPDAATTVAGPFVHLRRGPWTFDTLFPLWWDGEDDKAGYAFHTFFPFFHYQTGDHGKTATLITPLGGYRRDDEAGSRTVVAPLPPLLLRRDRERELDIVFPVWARYHDKAADSTTTLVPLFFYRSVDPEGSSTVAPFPFVWHFWDRATDATATAVLPFFARRTGPADTSTFAGIFPLGAYWRRFADGGWSGGLFPLAFFGRGPQGAHDVVFPLYWSLRTPTAGTTVAPPFWYHHWDAAGYHAGVPPLLWFQGNRDGESYALQFPLFWHFASAREGWSTTVVPPLFFHAKADGWSAGLVPFVFAGASARTSHFVLAPLYWHFRDDAEQTSTTVVLNFVHRRRGDETTLGLFPLLWWRSGARPGGTPESSFTLFPLVHYRRDAQSSLLLTPVAAASHTPERDAGFVVPYFWWRTARLRASGLLPLHFDVTTVATGERTRMFGPLFLIDTPQEHTRLVFPFWAHHRGAHETDTYVFPTYFHRRTDDGYALDTVFPLYWHSQWPGTETTLVGPWFRRTTPDSSTAALVPAFLYTRTQGHSHLVIPPLLTYRHVNQDAGTSQLSSMLLFYRSTRPDGGTTNLFPLWWSGHGDKRSHHVLFPVFWRFTDQNEDKSTTIAGPVWWARRQTRAWVGLLTAWHSHDAATGAGSNALLPLFWERHEPDRLSWLTPIVGHGSSADGSRWTYAFPYYKSDDVDTRFDTVFPVWFRHLNKADERTTTVVPPLLHVARATPEGGLSTWLALYWHRWDVASSTRLLLPLLFDVDHYFESRTTVFLPFFIRHHAVHDQTTTWLAPLVYARFAPQDSTVVGFPLYWRFTEPARSTTIGFPLYWDFVRGADRTTVAFPFYVRMARANYTSQYFFPNTYYRHGRGADEGTYRFLFLPLLEVSAKRQGDFMWEFLGGLFGYERIGRNRFARLFFLNVGLEPAPRPQTAWYGKPPKPTRRRPAVSPGVNAGVW